MIITAAVWASLEDPSEGQDPQPQFQELEWSQSGGGVRTEIELGAGVQPGAVGNVRED